MDNTGCILMVEHDPTHVELTMAVVDGHHLAREVVVTRDEKETRHYIDRRGEYIARQRVNACGVKPTYFHEFGNSNKVFEVVQAIIHSDSSKGLWK